MFFAALMCGIADMCCVLLFICFMVVCCSVLWFYAVLFYGILVICLAVPCCSYVWYYVDLFCGIMLFLFPSFPVGRWAFTPPLITNA